MGKKIILAGFAAAFVFFAGLSSARASWSGLYVGVNGGKGFGKFNANTSTIFSPTGYFATTSVPAISSAGAQHLSPEGFSGGIGIGYDLQIGPFVLGAEADFNGLDFNEVNTSS